MPAAAATEAIQAAQTDKCKHTVRDWTQEAIDLGGFGFPLIHLQGGNLLAEHRVWFGSDRLEQIAHVLRKPWFGIADQASKL